MKCLRIRREVNKISDCSAHLISQKSNRFLTASPQGEAYLAYPKIKRERGEIDSSPRYTPVSRLSDGFAVIQLERNSVGLSRQNLAALCTTASQNLAAVSGSHSLTETVDLGTMTLAGLIGTLHVVYTSYKITYARQFLTAATHNN